MIIHRNNLGVIHGVDRGIIHRNIILIIHRYDHGNICIVFLGNIHVVVCGIIQGKIFGQVVKIIVFCLHLLPHRLGDQIYPSTDIDIGIPG